LTTLGQRAGNGSVWLESAQDVITGSDVPVVMIGLTPVNQALDRSVRSQTALVPKRAR